MKSKPLFLEQAEQIIAEGDVAEVQRLLFAKMHLAGMQWLSDGVDELCEIHEKVRENFDGSEYQQGKKDGIRIALAILKDPSYMSFIRGGALANPSNKAKED